MFLESFFSLFNRGICFFTLTLPRVCRVYHMVYEGINKEGVHALGLATSADGVKWERKSNDPIFERSPPGR